MIDLWQPFVVLFATSLLVALVVTPLARRVAWRLGAVDHPDARRINRRPIPRMGGIAVFVALIASSLAHFVGTHTLGWPGLFATNPSNVTFINYPLLVIGFTLVFATGLLDDYLTLTPRQKLVGQFAGAIAAVSSGLVIDEIVNPFTNDLIVVGWVSYPITVLYLVAYTNIFNLIDGLDGLAAGIACIASVTMWIVSTMSGHLDAASFSLMLAGATLGFLRYNFNPASVFLGDCGSLLIGFSLGCISLMSVSRTSGLTAIIIPLVIAGIPIIDTFSAIVRRGRAHVSIGQADKGHIHHRLLSEGFNQRQTVLFIYAWTILLCVGSIVMTQVDVVPRILIFVALVVVSALFALRLHLFSPVLLHHYNPKTGSDELVAPQDPAFKEEAERFEEEHTHFPL